MSTEIRWKQRFQNFEKAYQVFVRIAEIKSPSEGEKLGLVQAFEVVFELSWKVLQDYLGAKGYLVKGPKDVLKQAFKDGIIREGGLWLEALESRNNTVQVYDESIANKMIHNIHETYFALIRDLYFYLKKEAETE
jgi:nucleotidyltransferase substrate binding protein (TIGR01987 family)